MPPHQWLDRLHCPYCGSGLELEREINTDFAVVRCACYRYPVIEGIPILMQRSGPGDASDPATALLDAGDLEGALRYVLFTASPVPPGRTLLQRLAGKLGAAPPREPLPAPSLTFRQALHRLRPQAYANYLFHRYANVSFLASIPLLLLLKELETESAPPAVLDLNCGVGHASFLIQILFPQLPVVATDHDFANLYLVQRYLAPQALCVCLDADFPLPFDDAAFGASLCLDGLHYVRSKRALLRELNRCVREDGLMLFPHLHNALKHNFSPGVALAPEDYARCFEFIPSRLLIEADVLRNFIDRQVLDLECPLRPADVSGANVLSLVASRRASLWRRHDDLAPAYLKNKSQLAINPIYRRVGNNTKARLEMNWPSAVLEKECGAVRDFLPESTTLDSALLDGISGRQWDGKDLAAVEGLMKSFVTVRLPQNYA